MFIDNQSEYWDRVAGQKTFTHPVNLRLLSATVGNDAQVVDYGCGYGRTVRELLEAGFLNARGFDTSLRMVERGAGLPLYHLASAADLPLKENSVDCFLLFAVLTCIAANGSQRGLINLLHSKLKPGGSIYISDYYLQEERVASSRYGCYAGDPDNYGVFSLAEGATFRHHTKEWIKNLLKDFLIENETRVAVKTMNGSVAQAFQLLARKY